MKPKFNVGDKVWVIDNAKAVEKPVTLVLNSHYQGRDRGFKYGFNENDPYGSYYATHWEKDVFASKEELIASL